MKEGGTGHEVGRKRLVGAAKHFKIMMMAAQASALTKAEMPNAYFIKSPFATLSPKRYRPTQQQKDGQTFVFRGRDRYPRFPPTLTPAAQVALQASTWLSEATEPTLQNMYGVTRRSGEQWR